MRDALSAMTSVLAAASLPIFVVIFTVNMVVGQQTQDECLELSTRLDSMQSSFDGTCRISLV